MKCKGCTIGKVLMNNGSTLNILVKHVLDEMLANSTHILLNTMTTRAYDSSSRQMVRTTKIEFFIGLQVFLVTL